MLEDLIKLHDGKQGFNENEGTRIKRRRKSKSSNGEEDKVRFEKIDELDAYDKPYIDYGPQSEERIDDVERFLRERIFSWRRWKYGRVAGLRGVKWKWFEITT